MPNVLVEIPEAPIDDKKRCFVKLLQNFMSKLLRKIDHKTNWAKDGEFSKYIPADEAPADALRDIATDDNTLSVWEIVDDRANLDRVLAAIASQRQYLQKIDFLVFDSKLVKEIGLTVERKPGETLDGQANATWHLHLIHLSASDLSRLGNAMFANADRVRLRENDLIRLLRQSIEEGHVDSAKLHPTVKEKILQNK